MHEMTSLAQLSTQHVGREPDLALVLTKAKKFSLRFLFSLTIGTQRVLIFFDKQDALSRRTNFTIS